MRVSHTDDTPKNRLQHIILDYANGNITLDLAEKNIKEVFINIIEQQQIVDYPYKDMRYIMGMDECVRLIRRAFHE